MQSLIDKLQMVPLWQWGFVCGAVLVAVLLVQANLLLFFYLRRGYFERLQRKLAREQMEYLVNAAKAQWRAAEQNQHTWNGYRKFRIARKYRECQDVFTFELAPHDGKPVPLFKPGQYLTFQLDVPGQSKPVVRCYSLSDSPHSSKPYRVTIKKALPPPDQLLAQPGLASTHFCDRLKEGDILNVKAPSGNFFLDLARGTPVVLISGGVGITPMLSMLNAIIESGSKREVWFFFGARNGQEQIQKEYLQKIAAEHDNVRVRLCYSRPAHEDKLGVDYHHGERVSVELFKRLLPSNNYEYFICGPAPFMKSITDDLTAWGVPDSSVFYEAFGPATVTKVSAPKTDSSTTLSTSIRVTFSKSGKSARWSAKFASLLDLAEEQGIKLESGCRAGNCGTCLVAIKSGKVAVVGGHGAPGEEGSCLTCICKPMSDLVLDA